MNPQALYRHLTRLLGHEFTRVENLGEGVVVVDDEGVQWLLTAEELPT